MIVRGVAFTWTRRPMMPSSPSNHSCHSRVTDQQNGLGGWPVLRDRKQPATNRSDSEQWQEVRADELFAELLDPVAGRQHGRDLSERGHRFETVLLRPPLEIVGEGDGRAVVTELVVRCPDHHHTRGVLIRQRAHQHVVGHGEDRDARAKSDGEGRQGGDGKPRSPAQSAKRIAHILPGRLEHDGPRGSLDDGDVAPVGETIACDLSVLLGPT